MARSEAAERETQTARDLPTLHSLEQALIDALYKRWQIFYTRRDSSVSVHARL